MARPKALTREQLQSRTEKAELFTRDVLGDEGRADEIGDESLDPTPNDEKFISRIPRRKREQFTWRI